jgi:hypothetical protein
MEQFAQLPMQPSLAQCPYWVFLHIPQKGIFQK